jgi:hypothetical protein
MKRVRDKYKNFRQMAKRTGNSDDLIPESVIFRKTPTKRKRMTSSNDENEVINSHTNDSDVTHISETQLTPIAENHDESEGNGYTLISSLIKIVGKSSNFRDLVKQYPFVCTSEGFESQINGNIAERYEHLHDSHNNYFFTFVTMGSIAFERLSETVYCKDKFGKYKSLLKKSDEMKCCGAFLLLQEMLSTDSTLDIVITNNDYISGSRRTCAVINTKKRIIDFISKLDSVYCQLYIDGVKFMRSKLVTSIYYAFMSNYAFCSQYEDKSRSLLIAIEKIFMRWNNSTLTEEVKRICDEILIK